MVVYGKLSFSPPPDGIDPAWWRKSVLTELEKKSEEGLKPWEDCGASGFGFSFQLIHGRNVYKVTAWSDGDNQTDISWRRTDEHYESSDPKEREFLQEREE